MVERFAADMLKGRLLPPELIEMIVGSIPSLYDLVSCSLVCRAWAKVVLPKVYRSITLDTSRWNKEVWTDGQDLVEYAEEFSLFMRSCVEELTLTIAGGMAWTFKLFTELLALFPRLKILNYTSLGASSSDPEKTIQNATFDCHPSFRHLPCLTTLRIGPNVRFDNEPRTVAQTRTSQAPSSSYHKQVSAISSLLGLVSIFQEIKVLDLSEFGPIFLDRICSSPRLPKKLVGQLPRLNTLITDRYADAAHLICRHLDPTCLVAVRDTSLTLGFTEIDSKHIYPNVTRLSGEFGYRRSRFTICSKQLPALEAVELQSKIPLEPRICRSGTSDPTLFPLDPIKDFVNGLRDAPPSLRHVTLTLELYYVHQNNRLPTFLDRSVVPKLRGMDWNALRSLFDSTKAIWETRKIIFLVASETRIASGMPREISDGEERKVTILGVEQIRDALRREIPILGSPDVSFVVSTQTEPAPLRNLRGW